MIIPFVDLKAQYISIKPEIDDAIKAVIEDTAFIKGKYVQLFEEQFAELYGVNHCIGVANGTDAIYITLKMLGIKEGDEVITVANSWISTSETISQTGATPVFIDVDDFFTIDVDKIKAAITLKTKAIIPVHLYGQTCDMDAIVAICNQYKLHLIEDCAQSHFSEYKGKRAGLFGIASTFSFFPGKNLGAYGDAGCILTNDHDLAQKVRMYASHGALVKHEHHIEGINSRLDGLQASILSAKLPYILEWTKQRNIKAELYNKYLFGIEYIEVPKIRQNTNHSFHLYVIKAENRNELRSYLQNNGIACEIHYPTPLPLMPAYEYLNPNHSLYKTVIDNQQKILSLPIYPELTEEQIIYVSEKIKEFYQVDLK
jgi:dTDP-4-amino-4,6-dideoxygalactose transaminase